MIMARLNRADSTRRSAILSNNARPVFSKSHHCFMRWLFWCVMLVVLALTLTPAPPNLTIGLSHEDKWHHALGFAGLTLLGLCSRASRSQHAPWRLLVFLLAVGGGIEVLQAFIPNRGAEWLDWLADAAGIAMGWGLFALAHALVRRLCRKRLSANLPPLTQGPWKTWLCGWLPADSAKTPACAAAPTRRGGPPAAVAEPYRHSPK
jgi:VanZ family protein